MNAHLISIGTELTAGLIVDSNSAWLAGQLATIGWRTDCHVTVPDDRPLIADAVRAGAESADAVVATGGLGPTPDDLTRHGVADALGVTLETDQSVLTDLKQFFARRSYPWTESNARQALVPTGARALDNPRGTAPGLRAVLGRTVIYCLPGVPAEMRRMFTHLVLPELRDRGGGAVTLTDALPCFGVGESRIGEILADLMAPGGEVAVGTTAEAGVITVRFMATGVAEAEARLRLDGVMNEARGRLEGLIIGPTGATLEGTVGRMLAEAGLTVATAESCTGGLLAKRLTDVPGSSAYFTGGAVTYSNSAKVDLLGVDPGLIEQHGAVSREVAAAMAEGCRERFGTGLAMATTGVAGPSGGTEAKPVGLVFVALASNEASEVRELELGQHLSRAMIRDRTCSVALNLLRRRLSS